jgi:hypothetical protein
LFTCRPFTGGNNETCRFTNPVAGEWYVMIHGYSAYSGVRLTGTYTTTPVLQLGVPITGIAGARDSQQFWKVTVPAGAKKLILTTSAGSGDVDLYIRSASRPTTSLYDCRSNGFDTRENCTVNNPQAGTWYVMIDGYTAFTGVTLLGQIQMK